MTITDFKNLIRRSGGVREFAGLTGESERAVESWLYGQRVPPRAKMEQLRDVVTHRTQCQRE